MFNEVSLAVSMCACIGVHILIHSQETKSRALGLLGFVPRPSNIKIAIGTSKQTLGCLSSSCLDPFHLLVDGYIKTTAVKIDYDSLKRKKNTINAVPPRPVEEDQDVYDDVAEQDAPNRCVTQRDSKQTTIPLPDIMYFRIPQFYLMPSITKLNHRVQQPQCE